MTEPKRQLTLGEFEAQLKKLIDDGVSPEAEVVTNAGWHPKRFESWRGDYSHLSIDFWTDAEEGTYATRKTNLQHWIDQCQRAHVFEFTGYKGGEYKMGHGTPVWVCQHGASDFRLLTGADEVDGKVVFHTHLLEWGSESPLRASDSYSMKLQIAGALNASPGQSNLWMWEPHLTADQKTRIENGSILLHSVAAELYEEIKDKGGSR